jgi:hypothetical protein
MIYGKITLKFHLLYLTSFDELVVRFVFSTFLFLGDEKTRLVRLLDVELYYPIVFNI